MLAKGGITSSDVATKGLGVKRLVLGQILPGVPVWRIG
ncbi:MAG: nucleotide-binding domain containing protein [Caldilineaceae bacterium]